MKKTINIVLGAAFFMLFTLSCEVERFPYDEIEQTQAFQTLKDANTVRNGLYAQLRNRVYGETMYTSDLQADLFNATRDFGNRNGFPHRWEGFMATDYNLRDIWARYYNALANINNAIENLPNIVTEDAEEAATLETILGEAYLLRAFYYHQLVIRWGQPYDAGSAASDLGVPLVLEYNPTERPARATVKEVYDQILADIGEAKARLGAGTPNSGRVTRDAALALESRVKLFMEDWSGVATVSNELIGTGRYPLVSTAAAYKSMWVNDNSTEIIFLVEASAPSELPGEANGIYIGLNAGSGHYTPDFLPQQWIIDLYEENDFRKDVFFNRNLSDTIDVQGSFYNDVAMFTKYPGNPELFESQNSNYQHKPKVFRIAETHLNLIEARYHTDQAAALTLLNDFRATRGLAAITASGDALLNAIKDERTRELMGEGFRLNDLMRWNMGVVRKPAQNLGPILTGPQYDQLNIPAGHDKFVWGIPTNDMTTNENLVQNPGW